MSNCGYIANGNIPRDASYTSGFRSKNVTACSGKFASIESNSATINGDFTALALIDATDVRFYGAVGDGVTDDTIAINSAINDLQNKGQPFRLYFPPGTYLVTDELDFSGVTVNFDIIGSGFYATNFFPTAFGADKVVFRMPENVSYNMRNLRIQPDSRMRNHPIGIWAPRVTRSLFQNIQVNGLGNTALFVTRPFNCTFDNINLYFNGWQELWKTNTATVGISTGSATITASSNIFGASDVGKTVIVQETTTTGGNEAVVATIAGFTSGTQVTLSTPMQNTSVSRTFSFAPVVGTVAGTTLTAERNIFVADEDVGRLIYLVGAGTFGGVHISRVASVTSTTIVELEDAAPTGTTTEIIFTPSFVLSGFGTTGETPINDFVANTVRIEGWVGLGLVLRRGTHAYFNDLKTHGRAWGSFSNVGQCWTPVVWDSTNRSRIFGWDMEFGGTPPATGLARFIGDTPSVNVQGMNVAAPLYNTGVIQFTPTNTDNAALVLGSVITRNDLRRHQPSTVVVPDVQTQRRLYGEGTLIGSRPPSYSALSVKGTSFGGEPVFISNGSTFTFTPSVPTGFAFVSAVGNSLHWGCARYSGTSTATSVVGSATFTVVNDTPASLNVDLNSGQVRIQNLTGGDLTFTVSVLG